ncbi:thioredoxin domain-containing protein [soil metagenome]
MAKMVDPKGRGTAGRPNIVKSAKRGGPGRGFWMTMGLVAVMGVAALSWVASRPKTTASTIDPSLPPMKAEGYLIGSPSAPVEVVEYADFECPSCGQFATVTEPDVRTRLVNTGKIRVRFLDFPLPMHKNTWDASLAASCANDQGKFWEMHDQIFATQDKWNGEATSNPRKVLKGVADGLHLDLAKYGACMDAETHRPQIQANQQEGERRGVSSTPSFAIGGRIYPGALPFDRFNELVEAELAKPHPAAAVDSAPVPTDTKKAAPLTPRSPGR